MKNFKKIMALVLAGAMVIGSATMAIADDPVDSGTGAGEPAVATVDYDGTVEVTGLAKGDIAYFYKVLAWDGDGINTNAVSGWYATTDYASLLGKDALYKVLVDDTSTEAEKDAVGITAEMAGDLAKAAKTSIATVNVGDDGKAVLDVKDTGATSNGKGAGMYMVLVKPKDMDVVYNPVFVSSDYNTGDNTWAVSESATYSDSAAAKKSTISLDKEMDGRTEDSWDDGAKQTTAIGDKVGFTVTTTIPAFGTVYDNPSFVLTDTLQDLALYYKAATDITVEPATYGDDDKPTYTIEATDGDDSFKITFKPEYLKTLNTPQAATITYSAIVTTTALKNVNPEDNTVEIEYTNNPQDETKKAKKFDETHNYTFSIDAAALFGGEDAEGKRGKEIVKVGRDAEGNPINSTKETVSDVTRTNKQVSPLKDAEFKLYTDAACTQEYIPKKADGTTGTALSIKSDADGLMTINGLDAGTYYLKETKAPKGFVKDPRAVKIEIAAKFKKVDITKYWNGTAWSETPSEGSIAYTAKDVEILESYTITVNGSTTKHTFINTSTNSNIKWVETSSVEVPSSIVNTEGVELPSTGGMGTTLFYVIGAILIIGAGILLVTKRRMSAN